MAEIVPEPIVQQPIPMAIITIKGDEDVIVNDLSPYDEYWTRPSRNRILKKDPILLRKPLGNEVSCIYKVPPSLAMMNRKYFDPHVVSIGPYHHGLEKYRMLQEHKARFFNLLVSRRSFRADTYIEVVKARLSEIKSCYYESINYEDNVLAAMIAVDGCFILEMFRMVKGLAPETKNDPILNMAELFPFLLRDFMLLENQIPFFVLQDLFNMSSTETDADYTLIELALSFFKYAMPKPVRFGRLQKDYDAEKVKHLLDLLRLCVTEFAPTEQERLVQDWEDAYLPKIPPATKLGLGGINIMRRYDTLINIGFDRRKGLLKIPPLILDDFVSSFLSNCVAFEYCDVNCTQHFSTYVIFMRCLTNKEGDAEFLSNKSVVENYLGTDADTADFFRTLAGGCAVDIRGSYLANEFYEVNKYYENKWHQTWAELWNSYFSSPWSLLSAAAVLIGLLLTAIQTHYNISPKH